MMREQFLEKLRAETGPMHKALEQTSISKDIISPDLTLARYKLYLQKVWCLHRSAEKSVFPQLSPYLDDINERQKSESILSDLKKTELAIDNCGVEFIDPHFVSSINFCFGIMYVIEGSTLGGMYIQKNVVASIGANDKVSTHFLNVYGQTTGSKWKKFMEVLDRYQSSIDDDGRSEIIAGAIYGFKRTFEIFNS